jgi:4-hydroxybenzoate polyprenyltransferase
MGDRGVQETLEKASQLGGSAPAAENIALWNLPLVVPASCLLKVDLIFERIAGRLRRWRSRLFSLLAILFRADGTGCGSISQGELDYKSLPLDEEFAAWLAQQRFRGRQVILLSDAPAELCDLFAERLNLSSRLESRLSTHSSSAPPSAVLHERFPDGFAYAGHSQADLDMWAASKAIIFCRVPSRLAKTVRGLGKPILAEFPPLRTAPAAWIRMFRPHHWVKNLLLFAPALFGNVLSDPGVFLRCTIGFVLLGIVASCTYLVNDVLDLDMDRQHRSKATRPFASGEMSVMFGFVLPPLGITLGVLGASYISGQFAIALASYVLLTLSYSFVLKRLAILDALTIAGLYVLRLVMGIVLADVLFSPWLLTFAMFFFFSLVLAKRQTEIHGTIDGSCMALREAYRPSDAALTLALGVASGTASIIVMNLYLMEEVFGQTLYLHPTRLWAVPIGLGMWLCHIWLFAHRGELHDDPVHFALRDPTSLILGLGVLAAFALAIL